MATFQTNGVDIPLNYDGRQFQMSHSHAIVTYDTTLLSDNSIRVHITKVEVFFSAWVTDPNIHPVYCTACCGTWQVQLMDDFGTDVLKSWNLGISYPIGSWSWSKNVDITRVIAPGNNIRWQIYRHGTFSECGWRIPVMIITNNNSPRVNTPPDITITCSARNSSAIDYQAKGNYGYCPGGTGKIDWAVYDAKTNQKVGTAIGVGSYGSAAGLTPNTQYRVEATTTNGCYTVKNTCLATTCVGVSIAQPIATSPTSISVRVTVNNGGGAVKPATVVQYKKAGTDNWINGPTTTTTSVADVALNGLEENTTYSVRAVTSGADGCSSTTSAKSVTTPRKCVAAYIENQNVVMDERSYKVSNTVKVHYDAATTPFDLWLEYRVKNGYVTTWEKSEVKNISGTTGSATFTLDNLFANLVDYELRIRAVASQDDCDFTGELAEFTTPLVPEPEEIHLCETLSYLAELVCQAVKKLYHGNITILANPTTVEQCDPYNELPTHLTLWSRLLRFFHAMNCILCVMDEASLKSGNENQYWVGELGWVDMLDKVLADTDSDSWRLVASGAIRAYLDSKLHEVWHFHDNVDYLVGTIEQRDGLPSDANSCIVSETDKVYEKKNGSWVEADEQPDDFGVYHINNEYTSEELGTVKAGSAWFYFGGYWKPLDSELGELEKRVEALEEVDEDTLVQSDHIKEVRVVEANFGFAKDAEEGVLYFVLEDTSDPETVAINLTIDSSTYVSITRVPKEAQPWFKPYRFEKNVRSNTTSYIERYMRGSWRDSYSGVAIAVDPYTDDIPKFTGNFPASLVTTRFSAGDTGGPQYTVTYSLGEAPGTPPMPRTVNWGASPLPGSTPTWTGHTFKGWYYRGVNVSKVAVRDTLRDMLLEARWD